MRIITILCLVGFALSHRSFSQENSLYLLAAHPFYDAPDFPSYLFRLENGKGVFDTIQRFSARGRSLREVKYYPSLRKIIFVRDGFLKGTTNKSVELLNMDTPNKLDSVLLDSLNYMYINSWLFYKRTKGHFLGIDLYNSNLSKKRTLLSIDLNSLGAFDFNVNDLAHAEISGNAGTCLLSFDGLAAYTNATNGELRIPESSDTAARPIFPVQLPTNFQRGKKERRSIVINNASVFVFSLNNSSASNNDLGYLDLAILDKSSNKWFKQRIKGNTDYMIRHFNNWIAGTVCSDNKVFDENGRIKEKLKRTSPGVDKRRQRIQKAGMPVDFRFDYFGVYCPGILYLINVETRNVIELNTKQGDSEILLVERDKVYYRINDEIFGAEIIDGQRLGKAQLLIKNDLIPDIHWAFFSK